MTPAVQVSVEDAYGNVVTTDSSNVTLLVAPAGTSAGGLSAQASRGVATFNDLTIFQAGTGYSLYGRGRQPGDGYLQLLRHDHREHHDQRTRLGQGSAVYGTPVTFTATVTAQSGSMSPASAGSVDFYDVTTGIDLGNGSFSGSGPLASTWTLTTGVKTFNVTAGDIICATYTLNGIGFAGSNGTMTEAVTPMPITVTAVTFSKIYDGTTSASAVPTITSGSLVPGDTAAFSESYTAPAAGTGRTLTPSGSVSDSNGVANDNVTFVSNTTGVITQAADHFLVTASPTNITAGNDFILVVTAEDPSGNVVTNYTGTIEGSSSDPQEPAPVASLTFGPARAWSTPWPP